MTTFRLAIPTAQLIIQLLIFQLQLLIMSLLSAAPEMQVT